MFCFESVTGEHLYLFDIAFIHKYVHVYACVCICMGSKSSKWKTTSTFLTRNATHLHWDSLSLCHQVGQTGKSLNSLDSLSATPALGQQTSTNIHDIFISVLGPTLKSSCFKGKHFTKCTNKWISSKPVFFFTSDYIGMVFFDFSMHPLDIQSGLYELRPIASARIKIQWFLL